MHPLEGALILTVRWLVPALVVTPILLVVPQPGDPFGLFVAQLGAIVLFGIALAVALTRHLAGPWFRETDWAPPRRLLAGAAALVALDTGAIALLTLASSAALRFDPSLQFLQLLSALDIVWAGAAIVAGAYLIWGSKRAAWMGGLLLGVFCVFSIWRYLDIVGFTPAGGWKVSGVDLMRYVIPFDMAAAVVAVVMLWRGAHAGLRTEQARLQS
jgi:hypothetical protein